MKSWISDKIGYLIFPAIIVLFVLFIWLGLKFDLGSNDPTEVEIHQQYGSRG